MGQRLPTLSNVGQRLPRPGCPHLGQKLPWGVLCGSEDT